MHSEDNQFEIVRADTPQQRIIECRGNECIAQQTWARMFAGALECSICPGRRDGNVRKNYQYAARCYRRQGSQLLASPFGVGKLWTKEERYIASKLECESTEFVVRQSPIPKREQAEKCCCGIGAATA